MNQLRFAEQWIIGAQQEAEAGAKSADLAHKHVMLEASLDNLKAWYGSLEVPEARRLSARGRN